MGKAPGLTLQASIVQDNVPVQVAPRLFVGSIHSAFNVDALKELNISHIVNLAGNYATFPDDFAYLSISIRDKEYANLLSCLPVALLFVEAALANCKEDDERGVLIHCAGGRSRSPAVAAAYLMTRHNLPFDEALARIRAARPVVSLNAGFEAQLRFLEKAHGDVFSAHQLMLQSKLMSIVQEREDGLLDMVSSSSSHKKHNSHHRGRHHHHMPSTPKSADTLLTHASASAACDDRGMIHGTVPSGFSLSLPEDHGTKGQHFIPSLRSMGSLFGCRACGENLFCASSVVDHCAATDRRAHLVQDTESCLTKTNAVDSKTKRPLLAKLRLRPQSPSVKGAKHQQPNVATGASKSNPTTPRLAVLKSAKKSSNPTSPQQPQSLGLSELPKSGSSSDLSLHQHRVKDELCRTNSGFWRSLTSFKSTSKRTASETDEDKKKKAVLSPKAIAIDLSTTENETDSDTTHAKFITDNTQQWRRQLTLLELSWADLPGAAGKKSTITSKTLSCQFMELMARDARTMALLEGSKAWYVTPPPWLLRTNLQDAKGAIICPNERCGARLGEWQWEGTACACGCGHVVLPAFALDKAALRKFGSVVDAPAVAGENTSTHSTGESVRGSGFAHEPIALHRPTRK